MAVRGALGVIEFGDTPTAVGEIRSWNQTAEPNEIDTTVMGTGNARFIPGAVRHQIEVELFFEDPEDAGQALIRSQNGVSTPQAVALFPFGKTTGKAQLTGNAYVMGANHSSAADGAVEMTCTFTSDEAGFTWGTVP